MGIKLFDAHCHLQDPRILNRAPELIATAIDTGVVHFAVNGVSEKDWDLVKKMGEQYHSVIPCFGLHPWFVAERTPNWFNSLKQFFETTPTAAVGEIGLDKGSHGKKIDFSDQVDAFQKQLQLAKDLNRPASVHCVRAFGDLLEIMKSMGPFPSGVILHSYLGSAEMVPELARLGAYFSFSGFLMSMKMQKAKKMLKAISPDRILLETDAPDALPKSESGSLFVVDEDNSMSKDLHSQGEKSSSDAGGIPSDNSSNLKDPSVSEVPKETLNHPANIHSILDYVATLLDTPKEELAAQSYKNAQRLFSYEGSKISEK